MRKLIRFFIVLMVIVLALGIGFVVWASNAAGPGAQALAALESGADVSVEAWRGGYTFRPQGQQPSSGLIFYPGGRVDYRAYAPTLRQIAAAGYEVVLVRVPLNLAIFDVNAAQAAAAAHPGVQRWAVGGHSLGGAMAAMYAYNNPGAVRGLVLWAAYPAGSNDLSGAEMAAASIYGTADGVADVVTVRGAASLLPSDTTWAAIEGGNHAQFGDYGEQAGDGQPSISAGEQWDQAARATIELLERMGR